MAFLSPDASRGLHLGRLLSEDRFDAPGGWDVYNLEGAFLQVVDGNYHIVAGLSQYVFGLNRQQHEDVVLEAEAYYLSEYPKGIYGILCRANAGRGYYFVISADGNFSIRRGAGGGVEALIAWQPTGAIYTGKRQNLLKAVCVDDYLALYINGQFVAETTDTRYHRGYAGLTAALPARAEAGDVAEVVFDNVRVWEAK